VTSKTIYVSTIIDTFNYGTVMQAVATRDVLSAYGGPVFIDYYRPQWTPEGHKAMCLERPGNPLANRLRYLITSSNWNWQRRMFREFLERELDLCEVGPYLEGGEFDPNAVYCVGSDQTWNFIDNEGLDPVYFLTNVSDEHKKIAFSASFGRTSLGEEEAELTRRALAGFDAISVRESSSVAILRSLGLDGVALKDPVLLCDPGLWRRLAGGVSRATAPYVLVYRLNENESILGYAKTLAEEMGYELRLVTFSPRQSLHAGHGIHAVMQPSPSEWLALFRDAAYVVTDSFHGTCFSLAFERPMTVFDPPQYSVRLTDVLRDFGLSDREVPCDANPESVDVHTRDVDWSSVGALKARFAREARDFLDGCVGEGASRD
jgi:hypothetical protein